MKNNLIINSIEVDKCFIKLSNAESLFLSEEISHLIENSIINKKNIYKSLKKFMENCDKRYFSSSQIF